MTLPTLIAEYQKRQTVEQLKVAVSTLSQGFQRMLIDESVDSLEDTQFFKNISDEAGHNFPDNVPLAVEALKKYFLGIKVSCTSYSTCMNDKELANLYKNSNDIASEPYRWAIYEFPKGFGININFLKPKAFESVHGCDVVKAMGGAYCKTMQRAEWHAFVIDVNGNKLPNRNGIDRFYFVLTDKGLLLPAYDKNWSIFGEGKPDAAWWIYDNPKKLCPMTASEKPQADGFNNYVSCAARIIQDGWKINYYWSGAKK